MIVPSAQMIEQAKDNLTHPDFLLHHGQTMLAQERELLSACAEASADFKSGYELGVQAARVLVAGLPGAIMAKVSI